MKKIILYLGIFFIANVAFAQNVGIGTNTPKDLSKLDVESTTSGFLLPRMTTAQRNTLGGNVSALGAALSAQYNGLMVYDITNNTLYMWDSNKSDFTNGGWNNVLDADASVNDADADPNNELQTLSQTGTSVTLSNGGGTISVADNDNSATNEIQDLSLSGNTLSLSGDASTVDLSGYVNTDNQNLSSTASGTNRTINISGGTGTTISVADNDNDPANEYNSSASLSGTTLSIVDGGGTKTVDFSSLVDHDWYKVGTTTPPTSINDNVYTQGSATIGATSPTANMTLDVNGNLFARKYVVQNQTDGGSANGIWMWDEGDANWGIYMGQSGAGKSLSGGAATAGGGFSSHAIRFRVNSSSAQGFIFENRDEQNLLSIRGDNGRATFRGGIQLDCVGCGSTSNIDGDGSSNWGLLTIQGRVFSANSNIHLSPPSGSNVIINDIYRAAGGVNTGTAGLQVESLEGSGDRPVYAQSNGTVQATENALWSMSANFSHSPDDWCDGCSGTGALPDNADDYTQVVTMPFSVVINGTSYNQLSICTNGWIAFGSTSSTTIGNSTIPNGFYSGPVIFPYWDDLADYGSGEYVRYGYTGTAGNRVYIVDYSMRQYNNSNRQNFQVQIHEGSGLINVKYRNEMSPATNGQSASIGFQISSSKGYPIVCNGKVLDDNRDDSEGWSVSPIR